MSKMHMERIDEMIEQVQTPFIKTVLRVQSKRAAYPKDCINDGALEQFVRHILELEKKANNG
jgi:hypothetical protein